MGFFRYGQLITWSALTAPAPFTGEVQSSSYRDAATKQLIPGGASDYIAMALHSRKAELTYEAKVNSGTTDFLDLSAGAAIVVTGISTGVLLVSQAVETWQLQQPKIASIKATHYPDVVQASPALAGKTLNAFTPDQAALTMVYPGGKIIYGTLGIGHASGVVHGLTITQTLRLLDDPPSPAGKILGVGAASYERLISLDLLAKAAAPAVESVLVMTGGPGHSSGYRITDVEEKFENERGKMFAVEASWIPAFVA